MRTGQEMSNTARVVTADELKRYPGDDHRYELVRGRVIRMSPVGYAHGTTVMRVGFLLGQHLQKRPVGAVMTEVGFILASGPDTVRAPDIAFVRTERIPSSVRGFFNGPPDMAIEVLSPEDRPAEVAAKVAEYLACGVGLVVVVDPETQTVAAHRPATPPATFSDADGVLAWDDVVPGFRCRLADFFE